MTRPTTGPMTRRARPATRRAVVTALGGGLALPVLAACGGSDDAGSDAGAEASPSPPAEGPLTTAADVPVGGGVVLADNGVVVTQPTQGDFRAFGSICTHQGCPVSSVADGTINCTCHGSAFSIETGEPEAGPATEPLPPVEIDVQGDDITLV